MSNIRNKYLHYLITCLDAQFQTTKTHIDSHRSPFSNNRFTANFSKRLKELTFIPTIENAEGCHFRDMDGNSFLDISMGFGVHLFGHKVPFLEEAISNQLKQRFVLGPLYKEAAEVAQLIHDLTNVERCAFYNSGTEAVMVAMRIAKAATGKQKVVIFEGSYHGTHDTLLAMKYHSETRVAITSVPGITQNLLDNTIILDFGSPESIRFIEEHASEIAAVLTEPVQSRHLERQDPEFLKDLRSVTAKHKIALLFDEVITGFRIANGGAAEYFDVEPDISIYGKILGGGMPIGVVAGKRHYLDYIDGGQWRFGDESTPSSPTTFVAGTFCHHPLTIAATKATLLHLKDHKGNIQKELNKKTHDLCERLNDFFEEEGMPVRMNHFGSIFRFQLKGNGKLLYPTLLKEGIYVWEGRNCFLSTSHTDDDIQQLINTIKKNCYELVAAAVLLQKKERVVLPGNSLIIQGAIEVVGLLDKELMELASRFLINSMPALTNHDHKVAFHSLQKDECLEDWLDNYESQTAFTVIMLQTERSTIIYIRSARSICDGWSLILFFKELAKCYAAFETGKPLPGVSLQSEEQFRKWINGGKTNPKTTPESFPARTIHSTIQLSDPKESRLFEQLLSLFAISLGSGEHRLGVPVAGQLISRNIRTFGACTIPIPVVLTADDTLEQLVESSVVQLEQGKKTFKQLFTSNGNPLPIIFNMDNLDLQWRFSGKAARLFPINEKTTAHDLVCNVSKLNSEVIVSLKYKADRFSDKEAQDVLTSFTGNIKSHLSL